MKDLEEICRRIRIDTLTMIHRAGSGHPGGNLSAVELMITLYAKHLVHDPKLPLWEGRDRVIFSKGHASALLYALLAEFKYFSKDLLLTYRELNFPLQGHPSKNSLPGVEVSTGSLGQGLSVGVGIALGLKLAKRTSRVYVLIGDGECDCGQIWEAAMAAAHYKLNNLCVILDCNSLQIDGTNKEVMDLEPKIAKWTSFGWTVFPIDGHHTGAISWAYSMAARPKYAPTLIIGKTTKGKGVSFMENKVEWHGKTISDELLSKARKELGVPNGT